MIHADVPDILPQKIILLFRMINSIRASPQHTEPCGPPLVLNVTVSFRCVQIGKAGF
jgi:hypothetical protein